jgi:biopolymer transport protein ExbD
MRRKHRRPDDSGEINVTPLLDIVFIMLIFFIVTTSFVREFGIDVDRPTDDPEQVEREQDVIFIEITATGDVLVDRRRVDIRAVEANVQNLLARDPDSPVVVSAHRDAESGLLVRVIDQARLAGAENVSIATEEN